MKKSRLKFKKLLNEYRSLKFELEYVREAIIESQWDFEEYYLEYCANKEIDIHELNDKNKKKVEKTFESKGVDSIRKSIEVEHRKEEFNSKEIFKQIARKFHPDTIPDDDPDKEKKENVFKRATSAIDKAKWGELFDIVDEYDLNLKNYDEVYKSLKADIKRTKKTIEAEKSSYSYLFHECEGDNNCRDNVVKRFLKQLFNI